MWLIIFDHSLPCPWPLKSEMLPPIVSAHCFDDICKSDSDLPLREPGTEEDKPILVTPGYESLQFPLHDFFEAHPNVPCINLSREESLYFQARGQMTAVTPLYSWH